MNLRTASSRTTLFFLGAVLIFIWLPRLQFMSGRTYYNEDEALYATVGGIVHDGGVPYGDVMEQKPPVHFYFMALVFDLFGKGNMKAVHVTLAALITLIALILYAILALVKNKRAGIFAALIFSIASFNQDPKVSLSLQIEWPMVFFTSLAVLSFFIARRRGYSRKGMFLSGILFGLAIMTKQSSLFDLAALSLFCLSTAAFAGFDRRLPLRSLGYLLTGALAVIGSLSAYFAFKGLWNDYLYAAWLFNLRYVSHLPLELTVPSTALMTATSGALARNALIVFFPAVLFLIYSLFVRTLSELSADTYFFGLWAALGLAAVFAQRWQSHTYFIAVLPPFCLLGGLFFEEMLEKFEAGRKGMLRKIPAFALLFAAVAFVYPAAVLMKSGRVKNFQWQAFPWLAYPPDFKNARLVTDSREFKELITYIDAHSRPNDRLFVWHAWGESLRSEIYVFSRRDPATRYVNCIFLTGMHPHYYKSIPSGALRNLMADLRKNRPAIIVDAALRDVHPEQYPEVAQYLSEHYRLVSWPSRSHILFRVFRRIDR